MICGVRYAKKWGMISKNSTGMKFSSSWIGENPKPVPRMPLSMPCYLYGEEDYEGLNLERLKWIHRIKLDTVHLKVMRTLRRFIEEDDMGFDEAAESAVEKRKFLLNRVVKKKLLSDESDDDEEAEDEVEASV